MNVETATLALQALGVVLLGVVGFIARAALTRLDNHGERITRVETKVDLLLNLPGSRPRAALDDE